MAYFTWTETNSDLDSKHSGDIILCRIMFTLHRLGLRSLFAYFFVGQESQSEAITESISGNVNEPK